MLKSEAVWIGEQLARIEAEQLTPVVELGSSTAKFRKRHQPYIEADIHQPLRARGVKIIHSDAKAGDGVDIVGDIYDPQVHASLRDLGARCLLCCNMFEHVADRPRLARCCDSLLADGGVLVVTVPHSYPLHFDPIDTYYRPAPDEIAAMFPGYRRIASDVVDGGTYLANIVADGVVAPTIRAAGRLLLFNGPRRWAARNHRLLWLWRPYKVAAVVLQKTLSIEGSLVETPARREVNNFN